LDENQYFASAIWAAVFLEAFLSDLAEELDFAKTGHDDLNGRIQQLQQYQKNHSPQKPHVPDEVVKRCHDIRNTRNRLVHDCGMPKSTLIQDAQFIVAGVDVILRWYRELRSDRFPDESAGAQEALPEGVRVFVSTITPHSQRQKYFLEMLLSRLSGLGIQPIRLATTIFDKRDPIGKARDTIDSCSGVIVVGLERSHAYFLRDKEGTVDQCEDVHRKYTSGWLHLEAGIANALGKEVFVLREKGICADGVFDRSWNTYPVTELISLDEQSVELGVFLGHLQEWVKSYATTSHRTCDRSSAADT
jgi:hypothetical protein